MVKLSDERVNIHQYNGKVLHCSYKVKVSDKGVKLV